MEDRNTSVAEKLRQEQRLITMEACTAEAEIGEKKIAVWATTDADKACATT